MPVPEIDEIDRRIIGLLESDGRITNRRIALEVDQNETIIARRLRRLQEAGAMVPGVFTDLRSFGYPLYAALRLAIEPRRRAEAEAALVGIEHFVMLVSARNFDRYDTIGMVAARDVADLGSLFERRLADVPGLEGFELHVGIEPLRLSSSIGILADGAATGPNLPLEAGLTNGRRDDLDVAIIQALMDDSRRPFLALAESLDVSEATIRRRVAAMTDEGALRFGPLLDPKAFGLRWMAIAWIDAEPREMRSVAARLSTLPSVHGLHFIAGPLGNLYASIHCEHPRTAAAVIEREILPIPGVRRVTSQEARRFIKYSKQWRHMIPGGAGERPLLGS